MGDQRGGTTGRREGRLLTLWPVPLPSQQRDSARNLEWLKTVRESHGSVELSSLSLATAINTKGIYMIGAPTDGQKVSRPASWHSWQWLCRLLEMGRGGGPCL